MGAEHFEGVWLAVFRASFEDDLGRIRGAAPDSVRGQRILEAATRRVEQLLGVIFDQLGNDNSRLVQELRESRIEIDFLRGQLVAVSEQMREANKAKRPALVRSAVIGLAALFGAVAGGAAEGVASSVAEGLTADAVDSQASGPSSREIAEACAVMTDAIETVMSEGARMSRQSPPSNDEPGRTTEDILDRIDELLSFDSEEFERSYIQTGPQ